MNSVSAARVLIVEDDKLSQKVTLSMLKRLGYSADVVSNGFEALRALELQSFYLVLMNVCMPLMDGMETTRQIRKLWQDKQKIVALTALAYPGAMQMCLAAGMDDYISKPVTMDELDRVMRKYQPEERPGDDEARCRKAPSALDAYL